MKKLQNGSDIRGVAIETPEHKINLSPEVSAKIALGFLSFLKKELKKDSLKISIGFDSRLTGEAICASMANALAAEGVAVYLSGLSTTPAMFMSCIFGGMEMDGAIMITASHLPYFYNGLKFFTKKAGLDKKDISYILQTAETFEDKIYPEAQTRTLNLMDEYSRFLRDKIKSFYKGNKNPGGLFLGLSIAVDAGGGAAGFFAGDVLAPLGADVSASQFLEPDGMFKNHIPNPENREAMEAISSAVIKNKCDLGIIFDTDGDRAALVASDGSFINRNTLIALISKIVLAETPGATIVTDSITSDGLGAFIKENGGVHHRFMRGYKNVINEAVRLSQTGVLAPVAIETSGHAALSENYYLDDGAYLVARILGKAAMLRDEGKTLQTYISELVHPEEEEEIRFKIASQDFKSYGLNILEELKKYAAAISGWSVCEDNHEGVRIDCAGGAGDGWFLLRLSLHEPVMPLNLESSVKGGCEIMKADILKFLSGFKELNI